MHLIHTILWCLVLFNCYHNFRTFHHLPKHLLAGTHSVIISQVETTQMAVSTLVHPHQHLLLLLSLFENALPLGLKCFLLLLLLFGFSLAFSRAEHLMYLLLARALKPFRHEHPVVYMFCKFEPYVLLKYVSAMA